MPRSALWLAKIVFRSGSRSATQAMKSVAAQLLPCCGGAMIALRLHAQHLDPPATPSWDE
jgi:hypothetical protein